LIGFFCPSLFLGFGFNFINYLNAVQLMIRRELQRVVILFVIPQINVDIFFTTNL